MDGYDLIDGSCLNVLFVHQNCPGQFKHLAPALAARGDRVVFVTQKGAAPIPGIKKVEYAAHRAVTKNIHPYLASSEAAVLNGQAVARVALALRAQGFAPDVMIGNPGWGETLFLKDIWPDTPLISMCEFFYRGQGSDVGFDPEFDNGPDAPLRARTRAGPHLLAIEAADAAYTPTVWQRDQFPSAYHSKIRVIHDGIDCERLRPDPTAQLTLPGGQTLSRSDEVLTYVARRLEPYRGFHSFMRALPRLLAARPHAQVVIVGGDDVSYGSRAPEGQTWRSHLLDEIGSLPDRVHFLGRLPYSDYVKLIQVSSVHAYFTYPFVLSWSMLEVMSVGGVIVGSATPPVQEIIRDGENGWLVDFFDYEQIAERLAAALDARNDVDDLRQAARQSIVDQFDLKHCLRTQLELIEDVCIAQG